MTSRQSAISRLSQFSEWFKLMPFQRELAISLFTGDNSVVIHGPHAGKAMVAKLVAKALSEKAQVKGIKVDIVIIDEFPFDSDEISLKNGSTIMCLPLNAGKPIRGYRANSGIID